MSDLENNIDEIDLRELFSVIWEARKVIIITTSIFAVFSVVYALSLTNYYQSDSVLVAEGQVTPSSNISQLGGLASMVGINLQPSSGDKALEALELARSRAFLSHLLTFDEILPSLMAAKKFDASTNKIVFNKKLYDDYNKEWVDLKPTYLEAYEVYIGMLSTARDKKTGFISISIEHVSPVFAKEFLSMIIKETNSLMRQKDLEQSVKSLNYLKSELSKTSLVEIRDSITTLIEAQLQTQMMAKLNDDYVLSTIEPPFIPEEKSRPSRSEICILITLFGGILSVMVVLIGHYVPSLGLKF